MKAEIHENKGTVQIVLKAECVQDAASLIRLALNATKERPRCSVWAHGNGEVDGYITLGRKRNPSFLISTGNGR